MRGADDNLMTSNNVLLSFGHEAYLEHPIDFSGPSETQHFYSSFMLRQQHRDPPRSDSLPPAGPGTLPTCSSSA